MMIYANRKQTITRIYLLKLCDDILRLKLGCSKSIKSSALREKMSQERHQDITFFFFDKTSRHNLNGKRELTGHFTAKIAA